MTHVRVFSEVVHVWKGRQTALARYFFVAKGFDCRLIDHHFEGSAQTALRNVTGGARTTRSGAESAQPAVLKITLIPPDMVFSGDVGRTIARLAPLRR
jgi:hypothetical protein